MQAWARTVHALSITTGAYSQGAGILKALSQGLEGKFNGHIDRAIQMNPSLGFGGPIVAKGRYWFELPWPKRSVEKSAERFKTVLAGYPMNLRARYYYAETLLKDGEAKQAKELLTPVLSASIAYDPPEGRRVQAWAKKLMVRIDEELN